VKFLPHFVSLTIMGLDPAAGEEEENYRQRGGDQENQ
jgi:hypothetical protein